MNGIAIGMIITVVTLVLLLPTSTAQQTAQQCMDADTRERTRSIMLQGIEEGFKQHALRTFDNWIKDPSDQPMRAERGMRVGISAYARSRVSVLHWSPPPCKEVPP